MTKRRGMAILAACTLAAAGLTFSIARPATAQSQQMKADVERLAMDVHAGVARSTLTPQQRAEFRGDFRQLREARQHQEKFAEIRAARKIRATLDSGAFKPEDRDRIKQDLQEIRTAREADSHHRLGM